MSVALAAGCAFGARLDIGAWPWLLLLAGSLAASLAIWWARPGGLWLAAAPGFLSVGVLLASGDASAALDPPILAHATGDAVRIEGTLLEDAAPTAFGAAFALDVSGVEVGDGWKPSAGSVRLSIGGALTDGAWQEWRAGRRVRVTASLRRPLGYRNFGTPDQEHRLALSGTRLFGSVKSAALVEIAAPGDWRAEAAADVRAWTRSVLERAVAVHDRQSGAIVAAVLLGDRAGLEPEVERRLRDAGTYHVIAISGGNIAILAGLALWAARRAGLAPRLRAAGAGMLLVAYTATIVGGSSVARATTAALIYLLGRTLDLRAQPLAVVSVTAGLVLAAEPLAIVDVGFWLTFLASLAILQQAEPVADRLVGRSPDTGARRAPAITRALAVLFAATLVAEGSLLPVAAYAFSQVTAAGLLLNFVAVPLMTVAQCAGLATLIGALVHPACAAVPGWIAAAAAAGIVWSASFVDAVPWTVRHVPPPPFWLVAAMTLAWWLAWHGPARRHRRGAAVVWATCGALLLAGRLEPAGPGLPLRDAPCPPPGGPSGGAWLRAIFLDVGQGDATFVRFPDGREWLIDAGGSLPGSRFDVGARIVAPALWALSTRRLDALIVTHGDHDHAGGVPAVLDRFAVRELWEGLAVAGAPVLERVRTRAALHGTGARRVRRGDAIRAGPVAVHVRHPGDGGVRTRVRNDDSVVLELRHGDVSLLLPGDAGGAVEQEIAPLIPRVPIRVLRAAHHGSARSTGTRWLDAIDPALVVISAGRGNPYGHPSPALLDRLRRRGTPWLRTDVDGAVLIDTDGAVVRVTTCGGRTLLFGKDDGPRRAGTAPVQPLGGRP